MKTLGDGKRKDLLDDVIAKGAVVTVKLIQNVYGAKRCLLAALFDKGEGMIDGVLKRIDYDDDDLRNLTTFDLNWQVHLRSSSVFLTR